MNKTRPGAAHELRQIQVALRHVEEGIDGVAQAVDVVEDEGDFLEMRHAQSGRDAGGARIEAIAVGGDGVGGPGCAGEAAAGDEDFIAGIGGGAAVFVACDGEGREMSVGVLHWRAGRADWNEV
jgi:hypothetical protein